MKKTNEVKIKAVTKHSSKGIQDMLNGNIVQKNPTKTEGSADSSEFVALNQSFISYLNRSKPKK